MTTQTYKALFKVTSFALEQDVVIATICGEHVETDIYIDRNTYEQWLSEGTGYVEHVTDSYDVAQTQGHRQEVCRNLLADYWAFAIEVNNESALLHLHAWLTRTEQEALANLAYLRAEKIIDVIERNGLCLNNNQRYEIKEAVMDYGAASRQWMIAATAQPKTAGL